MAKTKISEFSTTAGNNTDINSINIAEGCAPSGINDAIRELMRQLKEFQTGGAGDSVNSGGDFSVATNKFTVASASGNTAVAGTLAVTGTTTLTGALVANGNATLGDGSGDTVTVKGTPTLEVNPTLSGGTANGVLYLNGSKVATSGSALTFNGTVLGVTGSAQITTTSGTGYLEAYGGASFKIRSSGTMGVESGAGSAVALLGDNSITCNVGGSEVGRFTSTGLGIGTSSPASPLTINGNDPLITLKNAGTNRWQFGLENTSSNRFVFYDNTAAAYRLILDSSGNLGIGTTSPSGSAGYTYIKVDNAVNGQAITFNNAGVETAAFYQSNSGNTVNLFATRSGSQLIFGTNAAERARIDSSGNLLVGRTSLVGSERLSVEGSQSTFIIRTINTVSSNPSGMSISYTGASPNNAGNEFIYCEDSTAVRMTVRANGGISNYQANDVNLSDRREKTNFAPAGEYLSKICAIPVQTFNYIDQNLEEDPGTTLGVVAQDVQAVAPELVSESNWGTKEDPKMRLSIYQTDLQYALMKCIQEQQTIIETLTARVAALESK